MLIQFYSKLEKKIYSKLRTNIISTEAFSGGYRS